MICRMLFQLVQLSGSVRLFADDCLVYREIKSVEDQEVPVL